MISGKSENQDIDKLENYGLKLYANGQTSDVKLDKDDLADYKEL
ncbi:hypothetical protein OQG81_03510 [Streptococcus macedonicus]|uniref:Uncharacterized protein n=1 Tax=Streptococcus macedonicus TaxID=59310 RepID=A0AA47FDA0_STRMC|nr:hypothetical protein [Streptococcus macedonicus]WAK63929.1 hypothetical protein OQG81_03510 [Streptococcus macedonicus]